MESTPRHDEESEIEDVSSDIDSKYRFIYLAAQRSKQLQRGAKPRIDIDPLKHKPTRIALEEIIRGKVGFRKREVLPRQPLIPDQEFVALALIGTTIKVVSLSADGQYRFLDQTLKLHDFLYVDSFESDHLNAAIEELEWLVNNPKSKEKHFQEFFSRNKDFILNDEYKDAHAHIVLTNEEVNPLIPDFVLEPLDQGLCDLLELKLPATPIFTLKKNRFRYSAAVAEATAQLRLYGRFFEEEQNRRFVLEKYGLRAYKPKMFVIIGRRPTIDPLDERDIQTDIPHLHLRTYDDIIRRMKWRAQKLEKPRRAGSKSRL